ncbi:hypothetical protein AUP40_08915 [Thalassospira xiamenensis]|jgi:hypothetical protein|uniref:Glycosyl hydrolase family 32 N-terminal domain-containing protein n=2 Tax=Thalassospiraceae TaxID=2844866 RepID=A0ABR5Y6N6_9PROT|nr:hypothetical protein AUP40_08915 [Thalassospira xiamenensis]|tara:strand:+ start:2431 stop:3387 length:957 start_codon:yes stop_codon:yes gene_type:complete
MESWMQWLKKGLICNNKTFNLPWYQRNTMVPVPHLINDDRLRIFVTMCDENNVGRIGYVDVSPSNPSEILDYSQQPVLDIGADGAFDDNGVVTASILEDGNKLFLYYSGYQLCVKVPYMIFAGVAVSDDNGKSFRKISSHSPMLDRTTGEKSTRCAPFVLKEGGTYRMWYTADTEDGWINSNGKKLPLYDLKYLSSNSPTEWPRSPGKTSLTFKSRDEHGIAKCTLWKEADLHHIIYSIRSLSQGYRLGYAISKNGIDFERRDEEIGIDVSNSGWDSEMIAFAERFQFKDKVYLFYCGNHYGMDGMGYAELVSDTQEQ